MPMFMVCVEKPVRAITALVDFKLDGVAKRSEEVRLTVKYGPPSDR